MRMRKLLSLTCLAALLTLAVACKGKGSDFVGKWVAKGSDGSDVTVEIARNGESFIMSTSEGKAPIEFDKDNQTLRSGFITFSYVKTSDTLLMSTGTEFKRAK